MWRVKLNYLKINYVKLITWDAKITWEIKKQLLCCISFECNFSRYINSRKKIGIRKTARGKNLNSDVIKKNRQRSTKIKQKVQNKKNRHNC